MIETRLCSKCKIDKPLTKIFFYIRKGKFAPWCRDCNTAYHKQYRIKNKKKISKQIKQYNIDNQAYISEWKTKYNKENKQKISSKSQEYYIKNRNAILEKKKKYRSENKNKIAQADKRSKFKNKDKIAARTRKHYKENKARILNEKSQYYLLNREAILEKKKIYSITNRDKINKQQFKRRKNIYVRLRHNISCSVRVAIKRNNISKKGISFFEKVNFTLNDLKCHLESLFEPWMNWDNWGVYNKDIWDDNNINTWKWQIDHIIPQSDFPYDSMDHLNFQKCWSLDNLRPYSAKLNLIEGASRLRHRKYNE